MEAAPDVHNTDDIKQATSSTDDSSSGEPTRTPREPNVRLETAILFVGFAGLLAGIVMAHLSPADGYEVSLYAATPAEVWIGIAIAYLVAAVVSARDTNAFLGRLALVLGGLATLVVVALPVLRGYRFHGIGDSLTHLGWVRDMGTGRLSFQELFYPGSHTISVFYAETFALSYEAAALLMFVTIAGLFLLFVPFVVRTLTGDRRSTAIAAFSGFLFLPITNVSGGMFYHAFTLGVFFLPVVLFLLARYMIEPTPGLIGPVRISNNSVGLLLVGVALLFIHPQVALNVLLLLAAINAIYFVFRSQSAGESDVVRPVILILAILAVAWTVWISQFGQAYGVAERVFFAAQDMILGAGEAGKSVESQAESASTVGGSILELFFKLFFVSSIYTLIAAAVVIASFSRRVEVDLETRSLLKFLGLAAVVLLPFFAAHFLGDISHLFFRHVSFGLVFSTVFGAVGLFWASTVLAERFSATSVRTLGVTLVAVALVLSLLVAFPSPYIYLHNQHVPEYDYDGYEATFEHQNETVPFSGIRTQPGRYHDALVPGSRPPNVQIVTEGELRANPAIVRHNEFYLPVSKLDRDREVIAYRELRYSEESFEWFDRMRSVHAIQTNGDYTLYYVDGAEIGSEDAPSDTPVV